MGMLTWTPIRPRVAPSVRLVICRTRLRHPARYVLAGPPITTAMLRRRAICAQWDRSPVMAPRSASCAPPESLITTATPPLHVFCVPPDDTANLARAIAHCVRRATQPTRWLLRVRLAVLLVKQASSAASRPWPVLCARPGRPRTAFRMRAPSHARLVGWGNSATPRRSRVRAARPADTRLVPDRPVAQCAQLGRRPTRSVQ
jgi:hypothetical protein